MLDKACQLVLLWQYLFKRGFLACAFLGSALAHEPHIAAQ